MRIVGILGRERKGGNTEVMLDVIIDPDRPCRLMSCIAQVNVLLKDGRRLERGMEQSFGGPKLPLTTEQVLAISKKYAQAALSAGRIEHTMNMIMDLEYLSDILELMDILTFLRAFR